MNTSPRADLRLADLPLTGADCFLRAFDAETRRLCGASHLSQLVLRLGPGFDLDGFRRTLARVAAANPILHAPIRRDARGVPVYRLRAAERTAPPLPGVHDVDEPRYREGGDVPELPGLFEARLDELRRARRGELLQVDVVRYDRGRLGSDLAFTWLHMLFDGAGSEMFVAFLEACQRERSPDDVPEADRPGAPPDLALPASPRERGRMATHWQRWMQGLGARPIRSLAGPLRRVRQQLEVDLHAFGEAESARIREHASQRAGFLTPMLFYLAASIRAHDAVLRRRGAPPDSYVVPLPVNLRPKGGEGGLFRTRVSMLWFQVERTLVEDLDALLEELKGQRRRAIREGQIDNGVAAMDFARFAPVRLYTRMARRTFGGELCSFFFAYTDAFCPGLDRFFGAPVEGGFHAPAVPPSPGSSLIFSIREGRLQCTHVRQRGVLDEAELSLFRERLTHDLLAPG